MDFASVLICQLLVISACICFVISEIVNTSCIRKCCPQGSVISLEANSVCFMQKWKCSKSKVPFLVLPNAFEVSENNTLEYTFRDKSVFYSGEDFCLEFINGTENVTAALVCNNIPKQNETITNALGEKKTRCGSDGCSDACFYSGDFQNCTKAKGNTNVPLICPLDRNNCKNKVPFILESNNLSIENHFLKYEFDNQTTYFPSNDFCIDQSHISNITAMVCVEPPEIQVPNENFVLSSSDECFSKCCNHRSIFLKSNLTCVDKDSNVNLPELNLCRETRKDQGNMCMDNKVAAFIPDYMLTLLENYTLVFSARGTSRFFAKDDFCIDMDDTQERIALVCVEGPKNLYMEKNAVTGNEFQQIFF
ncbi:hypothetical protein Zmor_007044 [Zophobas morio]|uniref:Uncharacterized protein n=1 Tax=Zophobas morio TaxID=2755281 RepID=A0AA38MP00_9CUCU|nr:hypothetical protein Zmor_007044 [Zophobas morio]